MTDLRYGPLAECLCERGYRDGQREQMDGQTIQAHKEGIRKLKEKR